MNWHGIVDRGAVTAWWRYRRGARGLAAAAAGPCARPWWFGRRSAENLLVAWREGRPYRIASSARARARAAAASRARPARSRAARPGAPAWRCAPPWSPARRWAWRPPSRPAARPPPARAPAAPAAPAACPPSPWAPATRQAPARYTPPDYSPRASLGLPRSPQPSPRSPRSRRCTHFNDCSNWTNEIYTRRSSLGFMWRGHNELNMQCRESVFVSLFFQLCCV